MAASAAPAAPFNSLRDYVAAMEAHGNVLRIAKIDQDAYEGTALMYRLVDRHGLYRAPVVIFEEVKIDGQWRTDAFPAAKNTHPNRRSRCHEARYGMDPRVKPEDDDGVLAPIPYINKMPGNCRRCRHGW